MYITHIYMYIHINIYKHSSDNRFAFIHIYIHAYMTVHHFAFLRPRDCMCRISCNHAVSPRQSRAARRDRSTGHRPVLVSMA